MPRTSSSGKRDGILAPYVPEEVAKFYPADHRDIDGQFASFRVWLSIIAYNTNLVKAEDAPKSLPTCSIRNGRARSSRRIRLQAAPS